MICYLDRTFCSNQNCTCDPYFRVTEAGRKAAEARGLEIAYADCCGAKIQSRVVDQQCVDPMRFIEPAAIAGGLSGSPRTGLNAR